MTISSDLMDLGMVDKQAAYLQTVLTGAQAFTNIVASGSISAGTTITAGTGLTVTSGGETITAGNLTLTAGNIILSTTASFIGSNTADASDSKYVVLCGGGAADDSRGAQVEVSGNERASSLGGFARIYTGDVSGACIDLLMRNAASSIRFQSQNIGGVIWSMSNSTGNLDQDDTRGGLLRFNRAGKFMAVKSGANCSMGTAVLVGGTVTVSNTTVTASSRIIHWRQVTGGTEGTLSIGTIVAATSFVINSSSGTDTSTVGWLIIEPL